VGASRHTIEVAIRGPGQPVTVVIPPSPSSTRRRSSSTGALDGEGNEVFPLGERRAPREIALGYDRQAAPREVVVWAIAVAAATAGASAAVLRPRPGPASDHHPIGNVEGHENAAVLALGLAACGGSSELHADVQVPHEFHDLVDSGEARVLQPRLAVLVR